MAWGAGTVTNATQAALQAALAGGGTVTFGVAGVITLTNTIIIAQDTVLDAAGFDVTINGGNAVRLFQVNSNVVLSVNGLTLANGSVLGVNGTDGSPPQVGGDGFGGGLLNLGGTVALTDCTLTNHSARGGNSGRATSILPSGSYAAGGNGYGAALCNLGGALRLTNCFLAGNSSLGGTSSPPGGPIAEGLSQAGSALGGAVYSANGPVLFQGVTLTSNSVTGGPREPVSGGVSVEVAGVGGEGFGGAGYATNSEVLLSDSVLDGNSANGGSGSGLGGGLCLDEGSSSMIRLCRFLGNAANGVTGHYSDPGGDAFGGAVFSGAELQIWDSTFSSNRCAGGTFGVPPGAAHGGAICSTNVLIINGCTFDDNRAVGGNATSPNAYEPEAGAPGQGGAIWSSGALAATNSTWATNQAVGGACAFSNYGTAPGGAGSGGAVCITGGQAVLVSLTIADNGANGGYGTALGPSQGGGLYNTNGAVTVLNSIIADSLSGGDVWGAVTDGGYNICSDGTAGFSATGSLNSTNPLLGPLADNGGPTLTLALLPGSPALDAIPSGFPAVDQRGTSRPQGPSADIGAFEAIGQSSQVTIVVQPAGATDPPGDDVTFTVVAAGSGSLSYQWYKDGAPVGGATNSLLTLTNVQATDAGAYSVGITSGSGQTFSESAVLAVDPSPVAPVDPRDLQWRFSGTTNNLRSAASGAGVLVVVGEGGTILSSTDTVTWTQRQAGTTADLYGVAFGNGTFVAVGGTTNSEILTSSDGILWTPQPAPGGNPLKAVAWGANTFVAVGEQGAILASTNGLVWTQRPTGVLNTLFAVTATSTDFDVLSGTPPLFVGVGEQGALLTSPDGLSWSIRNSGTLVDLYCVASVGTRVAAASLVAAGAHGTAVVSSDGANWAAATLPTSRDLYAAVGAGALGNGAVGQYAVAGSAGAFLTSIDGSAWSLPASGTIANLRGLLPLSGEFLAVGDGGAIRCGLAFLTRDSHVSADLHAVAWGKGTYVAVGDSGTIVSSANGGAWAAAQLGTNNLYSVAYGDGRFVAVGAGRAVLVSTNGRDWAATAVLVPPEAGYFVLEKVAYGNRSFVASGYYYIPGTAFDVALLAFSPDGADWKTTTALPPGYAEVLYTYPHYGNPYNAPLCAGPDAFVVPGNGLFTSTDGMTWTNRLPGAGFGLVAYGSSHYVALGWQSAAISSDGTNWNLATLPSGVDFTGVAWGQGSFLAAGGRFIAETADGANWTVGVLSSVPQVISGIIVGWVFDVACGGDSCVIVGNQGLILQSAPRVGPSQLQIAQSGNGATLAIISEPNKPVLIQSSTNLLAWDAGVSITPTNSITYVPVSPNSAGQTFFRLVTP